MTQEARKAAPGMVVVLGTLWLLATGGTLLWSLSLLVLFGVIRNFAPGGTDPLPPAPSGARPIAWIFEHYILSGTVLGALSSIGIYAGIQFMRLKAWARGLLETGGWAAIALSVAFGVWSASAGWSGGGGMRVVGGILTAAFWAVFPATFVWLIRSKSVVPAFSGDR